MMKFAVIAVLLSGVMMFAGCAAYVTAENNEKYRALSKEEIRHLVDISRFSLKKSLKQRIISPAEYRFMMTNEPGIKINYRGDRFGTAVLSWQTKRRILEFRYEDDLTAEVIPGCTFSTYEIPAHERGITPDKTIPGR